MTEKLKGNNFPNLRFPGFEGEWEVKKLGEIGDVKMCRRVFNEETSIIGEIPFFKIGSFGKQADAFISKELYLDYRKRFSFPKKGSILISAAGTIGRTVVYNGEDAYYQDSNIVWIDNDNTKITNEFLFHILQIVKYNTEGGTIQRLYNNILKSTKFGSPTISEQNKIADFLTLINDRIQTQKKIIEELEKSMKGFREKIFSQKLRFKDDNRNDFPDWEIIRLKNFTKIFDGTHQTPKYVEIGIPFYSVESVTGNNFTKTKFISEDVFLKENERVKLEEGDILMTRIGDIGTAHYIDWNVNASFYVSLALIKKAHNYCSKYLTQYIASYKFQNELWNRTIHVAFPKKINLGEIGECLVELPSIKEQQIIADFLFSIDEKVETERKILKKYVTQKKYLLSNLFI